MPKFAVVIRHLPNSRPVTSGIIEQSQDKDIDNMDHYLCEQANAHIRRFKEDFVEFKKATWYIDLMNSHSNTPYETVEVPPES